MLTYTCRLLFIVPVELDISAIEEYILLLLFTLSGVYTYFSVRDISAPNSTLPLCSDIMLFHFIQNRCAIFLHFMA